MILTHLHNAKIKATTGEETIPDNQLFAWTDPDFKDYGANERGKATKATEVEVLKLTKDTTLEEIFDDPEHQTLTQHQIIAFCEEHKLQNDTFFLFKSKGEFFVALVHAFERGLRVGVGRFSSDDVWYARYGCHVVRPLTIGRLDDRSSDPLILEISVRVGGKEYKGELKQI